MLETEVKPESKKAALPQTKYVVLSLMGGEDWQVIKKVMARSAHGAIREVVAGQPQSGQTGSFVAVPERSWNPVKVTVETKQQLKLT